MAPQVSGEPADQGGVTWELSAALNFVIAVCYFVISGLIARGLVRAGELRTNRLGLATAGTSAPTVLRLADLALYEAKRRGRNRVVNAPALVGQPD